MTDVISWLEAIVRAIPLPLLEVWGRFSYVVGLLLAICAFGGFTFRIGDRWGFGRARQTWDAKAFLSLPLTFVLIIATGYIGSFIVLVPGAQTFESLKDLVVLLCIVLFGYPALIAVPPAYMLSDLIEGVPPDFVLNWAEGYFFWTAFVWMAYQLIGRNPDFRRLRTWGRYARIRRADHAVRPGDVGIHLLGQVHLRHLLPEHLAGAVLHAGDHLAPGARWPSWSPCRWPDGSDGSGRRSRGTSENAQSASSEWIWEAGRGTTPGDAVPVQQGLPIRIFIFTPFIALVLVMVGATAIVALRSADDRCGEAGDQAPSREASANIRMRLDDYLARVAVADGRRAHRRPRRAAAEPGRRHGWSSLHPRPTRAR